MTEVAVLSIKLESGAFEASVRIPIEENTKSQDFNDAVARWLALTATALQHGVSEMKATLEQATK
jgi:hypothetical protein